MEAMLQYDLADIANMWQVDPLVTAPRDPEAAALEGEAGGRTTGTGDTICWGGMLMGDLGSCSPGFNMGPGHFRNHFCQRCVKHGLTVDAARVRLVPLDRLESFTNACTRGLWASEPNGARFRIINHTKKCLHTPMMLLKNAEQCELGSNPALLGLESVPEAWTEGGEGGGSKVRLMLSKGTLVPLALTKTGRASLGGFQRELNDYESVKRNRSDDEDDNFGSFKSRPDSEDYGSFKSHAGSDVLSLAPSDVPHASASKSVLGGVLFGRDAGGACSLTDDGLGEFLPEPEPMAVLQSRPKAMLDSLHSASDGSDQDDDRSEDHLAMDDQWRDEGSRTDSGTGSSEPLYTASRDMLLQLAFKHAQLGNEIHAFLHEAQRRVSIEGSPTIPPAVRDYFNALQRVVEPLTEATEALELARAVYATHTDSEIHEEVNTASQPSQEPFPPGPPPVTGTVSAPDPFPPQPWANNSCLPPQIGRTGLDPSMETW